MRCVRITESVRWLQQRYVSRRPMSPYFYVRGSAYCQGSLKMSTLYKSNYWQPELTFNLNTLRYLNLSRIILFQCLDREVEISIITLTSELYKCTVVSNIEKLLVNKFNTMWSLNKGQSGNIDIEKRSAVSSADGEKPHRVTNRRKRKVLFLGKNQDHPSLKWNMNRTRIIEVNSELIFELFII